LATHALPDSAGISPGVVADTIVTPYNDLELLRAVLERLPDEVAAILVEPIAGNMGVVPPRPGFLYGVQRAAHAAGALLIADEVITGFRLRKGVIHTQLGARADLVTLGKIIGGGLSVAAYGGRRSVMETVAPLGPVYQAGTLAGNPVGMAAGLATLEALTPSLYRRLDARGSDLEALLTTEADREDAEPFHINRVGSMLGLFFSVGPTWNFEDARRSDPRRYARFFHSALDGGVYLPPSPWETTFLSAAVRTSDLERHRDAFARGFRATRRGQR
jgi:glutamate-1-semialdehyde 2,1-aminomutase